MSDHGAVDPKVAKALAAKYTAEAKHALIRAERETHEAREAGILADMQALELEVKERIAAELRVTDEFLHTYRLSGSVDDKSVTQATLVLTRWSRLSPRCNIEIVFNSPGGDVVNGMALFDFLMELRAKGHVITTVVRGYAASMAGILLQAGNRRVIGAESYVLIHEISAGMMGSFGELSDRLEWMRVVQDRVLDIFALRSGGKKTRNDFAVAWKRTDFWLDSKAAIEWGVADEIG